MNVMLKQYSANSFKEDRLLPLLHIYYIWINCELEIRGWKKQTNEIQNWLSQNVGINWISVQKLINKIREKLNSAVLTACTIFIKSKNICFASCIISIDFF